MSCLVSCGVSSIWVSSYVYVRKGWFDRVSRLYLQEVRGFIASTEYGRGNIRRMKHASALQIARSDPLGMTQEHVIK